MKWVKSAKVLTYVPTAVCTPSLAIHSLCELILLIQIATFISQHRRRLNGLFFAVFNTITFQHQIWVSGRSLFWKLELQFEFVVKRHPDSV